jgi:nucleoside-diphosphate-sugar epimerase
MKILVTGGGGFIGLALIRELVRKGLEVSTFSRNLYHEHQKLGIRIFQGDIDDPKAVESACRGIDVVFHNAAKVAMWGSYDEFLNTNVHGTQNIITNCIKCKVKRLIFTSSASVVFNGSDLKNIDETAEYPKQPLSAYTATKAIAEQLVLKANSKELNTIALRPHLVWGPDDTQLIKGILNRAGSGKLRRIGNKDFLIDTTYIGNYIDAMIITMEVMEKNPDVCGKAYFITNDEPVNIWDFINAILVSYGLNPVRKVIPINAAKLLAFFIEKTHRVFNLKSEPYITSLIVNELCCDHWFNITLAREKLGYSPRISNEKGFELLRLSLPGRVY